MDKMRAVVLTGFGTPKSALEFQPSHDRPTRKKGEVLVLVHATSVNSGELKMREGWLPGFMVKRPQILGVDLAGEVIEADADSKYKPGDRVAADTAQILVDPWGTYAEYCSVKEEMLCPIPQNVTYQQAAALPVCSLTAWQALQPDMPLAGKRVFVHGGSGGIGHLAIQIAKSQGAFVTTTCSTAKVDFCETVLKANIVIDYTRDKPVPDGSYDLVIDLVGATPQSWGLLKRRGRMCQVDYGKMPGVRRGFPMLLRIIWTMLTTTIKCKLRGWYRYTAHNQSSMPNSGLVQVLELVSEGKVTPYIDRVFPLEEMVSAHEYMDAGKHKGKVVIQVKQETAKK